MSTTKISAWTIAGKSLRLLAILGYLPGAASSERRLWNRSRPLGSHPRLSRSPACRCRFRARRWDSARRLGGGSELAIQRKFIRRALEQIVFVCLPERNVSKVPVLIQRTQKIGERGDGERTPVQRKAGARGTDGI